MDLIYELLQTPHGMTEMEEPLRNYLSTEKPINTNCSEKELSTQIETGIVKSVTDVFKGFFFFLVIFKLNLTTAIGEKLLHLFFFCTINSPAFSPSA